MLNLIFSKRPLRRTRADVDHRHGPISQAERQPHVVMVEGSPENRDVGFVAAAGSCGPGRAQGGLLGFRRALGTYSFWQLVIAKHQPYVVDSGNTGQLPPTLAP